MFQAFYSILNPIKTIESSYSQNKIDLIQTQFEFEDDKHLYLYDVPYFMDKSIIISGMVHNAGDHIEPLLKSLNEIYCIFNNTIFLIFESNSNDQTPKILKQWSLNIDINFCDDYKFNKHRKKNSKFRRYKHEDYNMENIETQIKDHKPSFVEKLTIFNDSIVINDLIKLQKILQKPINGSTVNLNRIERYTVYRNMILNQIGLITDKYINIFKFDYLMLIDLDLFALDSRMIFNELYFSKTNIMCANGVVWMFDLMYDIFAAVMNDGQWMHQFAFDDQLKHSQKNVLMKRDKNKFKLSTFPKKRFEEMRSCFGGITIYKNVGKLLSTRCKYQLIPSTIRKIKELSDDNNGYIMKDPNEELQRFADLYESWMNTDDRICEHLSFHYCLREYGYNISIATKARAYYSKKQVRKPMMNSNKKKRKDLNKLPTLRNRAVFRP